jgi:hypothetical protein
MKQTTQETTQVTLTLQVTQSRQRSYLFGLIKTNIYTPTINIHLEKDVLKTKNVAELNELIKNITKFTEL